MSPFLHIILFIVTIVLILDSFLAIVDVLWFVLERIVTTKLVRLA